MFVKLYDVDKEKADTMLLDCSNLSEHSPNAFPDADAFVTCITKKFKELAIKTSKLKTFISDGAAVMTALKRRVASKLRNHFSSTLIIMHCIYYRLGLACACADTGDD